MRKTERFPYEIRKYLLRCRFTPSDMNSPRSRCEEVSSDNTPFCVYAKHKALTAKY